MRLLDIGDVARGSRVAERRATKAELQVLDGLRTRIQKQVAARDARVDGARAHVDRDVPGTQEEELHVVAGVVQYQFAGVAALLVAGLLQQLAGGFGQ
ncbi:hypothetical protein GCM10025876_38430 [Demequina litorisediminis]|uniref:Uncharacterized protein n=1 Tax=Demequina litorisediminis TaxID=1849022 RepID=A0ABQ6IIU3_9MICO|nr:hypothetical protein GCM10025876_38430 [Demequina litorisediminis]